MSREELRNIRMVEAFNVAQAKREQRQLQKSARLSAESSSPVPDCCSEAPCSLGLQAAAEQALHFSSAATLPLHAAVPVAALSSSGFCRHGKRRNICKDCGGGSICQHGRARSKCKDCGGGSLCHPGSRLCAQAKSGRRLVVGCLTSRRFGPRCATSCSGDTCRCFLRTTTLLSLCCCHGTSFACCPCPPAKSGFLSRCLTCRPASRPLGSRRANSGLCGDLARCRRRFIEQRHLPAWQGEVPVQGLRGQRHLPAWQREELLQGLWGRQHLPAWQGEEQMQGLRGQRHLPAW